MEKKNKVTKKLLSVFWSILYSLPLIMIVLLFINGTYRQNITLNGETIDNYINSLANMNAFINYSNLFNNYLGSFEITFLNIETLSNELIIVNAVINWYVIITLVHIIVDILLFIPNIVLHLLRKVGVKDVE